MTKEQALDIIKQIAFGPAEHKLQQIVNDISRRLNIEAPMVCCILLPDPVGIGATEVKDKPVIVANPYCVKVFSDDQLYGILAHELGHVLYGDVKVGKVSQQDSYKREMRCDALCAGLGYGNGLGSALCLIDQKLREVGGCLSEEQHPPVETRLCALAKIQPEGRI